MTRFNYTLWTCQNDCEALLDNILLDLELNFRQIVGISIRTNCAPLDVDLFLFCYERDFITSLSRAVRAADSMTASS